MNLDGMNFREERGLDTIYVAGSNIPIITRNIHKDLFILDYNGGCLLIKGNALEICPNHIDQIAKALALFIYHDINDNGSIRDIISRVIHIDSAIGIIDDYEPTGQFRYEFNRIWNTLSLLG